MARHSTGVPSTVLGLLVLFSAQAVFTAKGLTEAQAYTDRGRVVRDSGPIVTGGLIPIPLADSLGPSSNEILSGVEHENNRRHLLLKQYTGSRQYTLQNSRFGKQAAVAVLMSYRQVEGERYTVLARSGSEKLNGIIDRVIASEAVVGLPPENTRYEITSANYRVRLLGTEVAAGRNCYALDLTPRIKNRYLIIGEAWVDTLSYAVVRIDGHFAASLSMLVGAPHITEEFLEVRGFWLPAHVRSVSSSLLLGPTELDILFSNYQFERDAVPLP